MKKKDGDKDFAELNAYSKRNIADFERKLGAETVARAKEIAAGLPLDFKLFHETDSANIADIQKDGFIYSFDTMAKIKKGATTGMTVPSERLNHTFNLVSHGADHYRNFVYARPVVNGINKSLRQTGFQMDASPENTHTWMSFEDPNQLNSRDMESVQFGMSVRKRFSTGDVYAGEDIKTALVMKAMSYLSNADLYQRINVIRFEDERDDRLLTLENVIDTYFMSSESMVYHEDCAYDSFRHNQFLYGEEMEAAGITYDSLGAVRPEIMTHPDFDRFFAKMFETVCRDVSRWGQAAVHDRISVKNADVFIHGRKQDKVNPPAPSPDKKNTP